MRVARIIDSEVVSVEVWDKVPPDEEGVTFVATNTANIGDCWSGSVFIPKIAAP